MAGITGKSDSTKYDEIIEVAHELRLSEREMEFLEDIEERAHDDELTTGQSEWLDKIYKKACDSKF